MRYFAFLFKLIFLLAFLAFSIIFSQVGFSEEKGDKRRAVDVVFTPQGKSLSSSSGTHRTQIPYRQNLKFDHLSVDEGLSMSVVSAILKDHRGLMWFGTRDGLNCYDGYTFKVYHSRLGDVKSLSDGGINCLFEDRQGELWIGTRCGLNRWDEINAAFIRYTQEKGFTDEPVNAICEDRNGDMWIGTLDGLFHWNRRQNIFNCYKRDTENPNSIADNRIKTLYIDASDILWIGTENAGLNAYAAPLGPLAAGADTFAGAIPTILKMNSSNSLSTKKDDPDQQEKSGNDVFPIGVDAFHGSLPPPQDDGGG